MQCSAVQCSAMQCNAVQYNTIRHNTIQYNTIYNIIMLYSCMNTICSAMQLYERNIWILTVLVENIGGISNMCIYGYQMLTLHKNNMGLLLSAKISYQ